MFNIEQFRLAPNSILGKTRHRAGNHLGGCSMTEGKEPQWNFLFMRAVREPLNSPQITRLVKEAETAISQRLQELRASAPASAEREAIQEALESLRYVKGQQFGHSANSEPRSSDRNERQVAYLAP